MLIVTINDAPGYKITKLIGEVSGLTVRTRHIASQFVAGRTKQLAEAREEALERLSENARQAGANAIIAMRFDSNELSAACQEILAYGTAVVIEPLN